MHEDCHVLSLCFYNNTARTCTEAGLGAGCCSGNSPLSCHVSGGDCNCDSYCITYNDCCPDVPRPQCCKSK